MLLRISHLLTAITLLFVFESRTFAQPPAPVECPAIDVEAPQRTLGPNEVARFTVRITPKKPEWNFRYYWTLTHGQPLTGQGTDTITVQRPPGSVVDATVNIAGGPDDSICPAVSSERVIWNSAANDAKTAECPTLEVNGPAGADDGELIKFEAKVSNGPAKKIGYEWTVSKGQIVEGQGTASITVYDEKREGGLVATAKVLGFPKGCAATASETTAWVDLPHAILIDEFEGPITKIPEEKLRLAAGELKNNPNNILFLIAYFSNNFSEFDSREAVRKTSEFLVNVIKLNSKDIEIVIEKSEASSVKIYRLPPFSSRPTP